MKSRPQTSLYIPPHLRLPSLITLPPPFSPIPASSPTRHDIDDTNINIHTRHFVNCNPNLHYSKQQRKNQSVGGGGGGGNLRYSPHRNGSPRGGSVAGAGGGNLQCSAHQNGLPRGGCGGGGGENLQYSPHRNGSTCGGGGNQRLGKLQHWKGDFQYGGGNNGNNEQLLKWNDSQRGSIVDGFEPSSYSTGFGSASATDNVDHWKWKFSMLLKSKDKQELISREKKDRRDFEQIAALAKKMGLHSHSYAKVVVFSKFPLPNYIFDLDEKRPQREVVMDFGLQRKVAAHLNDYLSHKLKTANNLQDNGFSRSSSSGSIATDEGLFEQPEPLNLSSTVMERIIRRRNSHLYDQQLYWQECSEGRRIMEFRRSLPAYKERAALITAISCNQVIIVSGETGCGKTTQIPQFILESEIESGRGALCSIICTQPR